MEKKQEFKIGDFKPDWIKKKIGDDAIHFMEGMGIHICDRKVKYDTQTEQYAPIDERVGYNAITTSQIRNIFGEVKRIEIKTMQEGNDWFTDFLLLKPKLAYATARVMGKQRDSKIKDFQTVLVQAYKAVLSEEQKAEKDEKNADGDEKKSEADAMSHKQEKFKRFSQFFEGVLAYHKAYGGKE